MSAAIPTYEVVLATPGGEVTLEVPTYQGAEVAARRAFWIAVAKGWGEPDEITVVSTISLPNEPLR